MEQVHETDVAVIGDGLMGLACAMHIRDAGYAVTLIGRPTAGRASTAAAGMLTPACEYDPWMPAELYQLYHAGLQYYPQFLSRFDIDEDSCGYRPTDFTVVDLLERTDSLQDRLEWMNPLGINCEWLTPAQLHRAEPALTPLAYKGGIRVRGEAVVNPRTLLSHMRARCGQQGIQMCMAKVAGVADRGELFSLELENGQTIRTSRVVIAAGPWSTQIGEQFGLDVPLCPVKGQIVRLQGPPKLFQSVIFMPTGGCGSIVERSPGEYIIGTSEEYLRPMAENTAGVVGKILSRLCAVVPQAADWPIAEMWSGFRPMTSDEMPIIDRSPDGRVFTAAGHHRNGVLLAPLTGKIVTALLTDDQPGLDIWHFRQGRPLRPHTRFATKY